ncbi:MAG TPA: putative porin [Flavipsychrobacter sp.]|nr:putative porin [Flavipsychrobacter sp.]
MRSVYFYLTLLFSLLFSAVGNPAQAQAVPGTPVTLQNAPQRDTSSKTNSSDWEDAKTKIYYRKLNSRMNQYPDSLLHTFHRRAFSQPWYQNTGNSGSPITNLFFTPEYRTGPTLGYRSFDPYRYQLDSLKYYNTTNPYTQFVYQLASKQEQYASILHTQNIKPYWNFAFQYRKTTSPGFYKIQRTNQDNGFINTNYTSRNQHYTLNAGIVYNKEQNDENGGIVADSFLSLSDYSNRQVIPVRFESPAYSARRSHVTNVMRDFGMLLQHSYTVGKSDTTYSADSSQYFYKLTPRFRVTHRLQMESQKYQFKDLEPEAEDYAPLFDASFDSEDSVLMEQKWFYVDNALLLNGFIGKEDQQLEINAGIGVRTDRFSTYYVSGESVNSFISNYLEGSLKKEALRQKQWSYEGAVKFFFTGQAAGNFLVDASIGKDISKKLGRVQIGFQQSLNNAPYNYTIYNNRFYNTGKSYGKESITRIAASWDNAFLKLSAGLRNYLVTNYIYLNQQQQFDQSGSAFNITQLWLNKRFSLGILKLDNEIAYQQKTGGAPVNVPGFMGRHKLFIETKAFKRALDLATGFDVRYHTPYEAAGYSPFFNRFYYQDATTITNYPEVALFFNFKIKNFRAYVMGDQLQQLIVTNNLAAPNYPTQNFMIRFGFNWVMIN